MKSLYELCVPREDVFVDDQVNDALDLADLKNGKIDADRFFEETYVTDGMKELIDNAFQRFSGIGSTGLVRLRQAMGGGKTHNMIALGLLAQYPELRSNMPKDIIHGFNKKIKVVSYTGRESDIQYGIWGEIAKQLGKLDNFKQYFDPIYAAPGQTAWEELLKGEPTLILLDELAPYLSYINKVKAGNGMLAPATETALANLFNAVNKLPNVFVVVGDLTATYEDGGQVIENSFKNLDGEIARTAREIIPVRASSDDLYFILKKKLFSKLPNQNDIVPVATEFKDAVNKARQMGYTSLSADSIYSGVCEVYPFHPCIKDIFARFKENNNFQQTRGFIRLARLMVRSLYIDEAKLAKTKYLINAYDFDLKDDKTTSMINGIKSKLSNAISHDISNEGRAAAEEMDATDNSTDMQEIAKMILMASLGDVTGVVLGLSVSEIIGNMVMPDRDMSNFKKLIEQFNGKAWYLYTDKDGRLFFKDIQNVNARLNSVVTSYSDVQAKQEIKKILERHFAPKTKDCFQKVLVFPSIADISLSKDAITLVLFEPNNKGGLADDLVTFFNECDYPNRVMFLSGQHDTMSILLEAAKERKAIDSILQELHDERVSENDTQYLAAMALSNRISMKIRSAVNETFVTLYYPAKGDRQYSSHEIQMNFESNDFNPEAQVRDLLVSVGKFTVQEKTETDTFRKKIEAKIFTARKMTWADITERAAITCTWNWYYPTALRDLKNKYVIDGYWAEDDGMIDKEPPAPKTAVTVRETHRDKDGTVTLKVMPENGDIVYYEVEQEASNACPRVSDLSAFKTKEMCLYFLCEDTKRVHKTGEQYIWRNNVEVQYNFFDDDYGNKRCELKANNSKVKIKYTTDGSNVRDGAVYLDPFIVDKNATILQAVAFYEKLDIYGDVLTLSIPKFVPGGPEKVITVDDSKPLILDFRFNCNSTRNVYDMLALMDKLSIGVRLENVLISDANDADNYVDISAGNHIWSAVLLKNTIEGIRKNVMDGKESKVTMTVLKLKFNTGAAFKKWVAERKEELSLYNNKFKQ